VSRAKIAVVVVAATFLFGACANKDSKPSDVEKVIKDAGGSAAQAKCVSSGIDDPTGPYKLSQGELNDLAAADHVDDIPSKISKKIEPLLDQCLKGTGATTSTTAPGATTSTTAG
jgi:hypothetical protein